MRKILLDRSSDLVDLVLEGSQALLESFFVPEIRKGAFRDLLLLPQKGGSWNLKNIRKALEGFDLEGLGPQSSMKTGFAHIDPFGELLQGEALLLAVFFYGLLEQNLIENCIFVVFINGQLYFCTVVFVGTVSNIIIPMATVARANEYYIQTLWRQLSTAEKHELLRKLGRSEKTLYRWFKNPGYIPYIHLCEIVGFYNSSFKPKSRFTVSILITPTKDLLAPKEDED